MSGTESIKTKKLLYRRRYVKWLIGKHRERQEILEKELDNNNKKIEELWEEFNQLMENRDG